MYFRLLRIAAFSSALTAVLFTSCLVSPLSDVDLSDPSLVIAEINLEKSVSVYGNTTRSIKAAFRDKNGAFVLLKSGSVSVNSTLMAPVEVIVPYYTVTSGPQMAVNSSYAFEIVLSDSHPTIYTASIQTQAEDLTSFSVPTTAQRSQPFTVSWSPVSSDNEYTLSITKEVRGDSNQVSFATDAIPITNPSSGTYTFPANYFGQNIQSARLTLSAKKYGTIDSRFRDGSYIASTLYIEKNILVEN